MFMNAVPKVSHEAVLESARQALRIEMQALSGLQHRIDNKFLYAVTMLLSCTGRVIVSGVGKTGHIARKVAATLASTGTPALFLHAAEATHGDLGVIVPGDILIALSYSGEGQELLTILPTARRKGAKLISITGNPRSEIAVLADIHLDISVGKEACPLGIVPTASTTVALALGDILAIACLKARGFDKKDFAHSHPGGTLGRKLLTYVCDIMHQGSSLPKVLADTPILHVLEEIADKGLGMTAVVDTAGHPRGIFTEYNLHRMIKNWGDIRHLTVNNGMECWPHFILPNASAASAAQKMLALQINQILVLDESNILVGILKMSDLIIAKVL